MSWASVAIDAAMLAATVDVDSCIEAYIGAVVVGNQ